MPPTYESTIKRIETLQCFNFPGHEKVEKKPYQNACPVSSLAEHKLHISSRKLACLVDDLPKPTAENRSVESGTYSFQGNAFPPQFASHRTTMLTSFIRHSSLFSSTFRLHPSKEGGLSGLTLLSTFFLEVEVVVVVVVGDGDGINQCDTKV